MSVASRIHIVGALALGVALFCSFFPAQAGAAEAKAGDIAIVDAWSRATPAKSGGIFVTLRNDGASDDKLVGVSTTVAKMADLHETIKEDGIMKMRPVDGITVPAHGTVALQPGGYHIMLMGLSKPLTAGETFPVTLTFAKAGAVTVTVAVKTAGASGSMDHMKMDHMDMDHKANP
jgi:copper(I)-binding protein